jgi:hypothetical protein
MLSNNQYPIPQREPLLRIIGNRRSCVSPRKEFPEQSGWVFDWANEWRHEHRGLAFSMAISTDNVVFDREPLKVDRLWAVAATHPSGQQEHIVGFHTEGKRASGAPA